MKQLATVLVAAAFMVGCESNANKPAPTASNAPVAPAQASAQPQAPALHYVEQNVKGRIIVVGTKASAEKLATGGHPATSITRINYGPKGETVIFEADKDGVEHRLIAEFDKRHGRK